MLYLCDSAKYHIAMIKSTKKKENCEERKNVHYFEDSKFKSLVKLKFKC